MQTSLLALASCVVLVSLLPACSGSTDGEESGAGGTATGELPGTGGGSNLPGSGGGSGVTGGSGGSGGGTTVPPVEDGPRVVGYLPTWRSMDASALDLDTLTHINIAFANPGSAGLDFDAKTAEIPGLVTAAHEKGVKVLASLAGASGSSSVAAQITPGNVDAFVADCVALVSRYGLDGLDVDIEGNDVDATYEPFVTKLRAALPAATLLTAAVANWNGDSFSDGALATFDFINVMAYDECGTWTNACEHSTYAKAESDMAYWTGTRGLDASTVVLGVPFYGYCWGSACADSALTWAQLSSTYPEAQTSDWLSGTNYEISLNSPPTIEQKTVLSGSYGGIMIWELGQDASGDDSLFAVIRENL